MAAIAVDVDERTARMTALYDEVCLRAFPDDAAVARLAAAKSVREFTLDEVKITMLDDPARGWALEKDGSASIWLELPPYHACSVRWNTPRIGSFDAYRVIADKFESSVGGFKPMEPYNADRGNIHIHAVGEQRILQDQSAESLFVFDQTINDPKQREAGMTGAVLRFVHQFAPPKLP